MPFKMKPWVCPMNPKALSNSAQCFFFVLSHISHSLHSSHNDYKWATGPLHRLHTAWDTVAAPLLLINASSSSIHQLKCHFYGETFPHQHRLLRQGQISILYTLLVCVSFLHTALITACIYIFVSMIIWFSASLTRRLGLCLLWSPLFPAPSTMK